MFDGVKEHLKLFFIKVLEEKEEILLLLCLFFDKFNIFVVLIVLDNLRIIYISNRIQIRYI